MLWKPTGNTLDEGFMTDSPLLPVKDALDRILSDFAPLPAEPVDLFSAAGRVLAQDVVSEFDLPPFDNSSMDGFALHAADRLAAVNGTPLTVKVIGDIPAGVQPTLHLQPGQTARIMTGAPLPAGADCVVPVEDTDFPYRETRALPEKVRILRFPSGWRQCSAARAGRPGWAIDSMLRSAADAARRRFAGHAWVG